MKGAFEKVNDDSTLNETARRQWIDSYSRVAIELVQKLTSQGWIPEGNEVELVEWMDDHPEIQKLLKSVGISAKIV